MRVVYANFLKVNWPSIKKHHMQEKGVQMLQLCKHIAFVGSDQ